MVYVHVEITLERPKESFLCVMMNTISPLISQNQLHTLNRTMTIISLEGFYAMHHQILRIDKNMEAFFIAIMRPSLNEQIDSNALILFRNGVT